MFVSFDTKAGVCELGVWLAPEAEGQGLVTRASRVLIDWAIGARGMSRVEWHTSPANERSKAVARRLGMSAEGVLRSSFVLAGERQDTEIWSVLADEWPAEPGRMFSAPLADGAVLGPLEPWHAEEFADAVESAREHLKPWIPFAHRVVDADTARAFLQRFAGDHARDARHIYGIWSDGRLVGGTLFPSFDTKTQVCEIGVWLAPEAQGRGLITRAARLLADWAVRERGMIRVEWLTSTANERSKAVAQRLGMTLEGVTRSSYVLAGERQDMEIWSVLANEWTAQD
jgi:ribosomal-protein-serine acetyltransferase